MNEYKKQFKLDEIIQIALNIEEGENGAQVFKIRKIRKGVIPGNHLGLEKFCKNSLPLTSMQNGPPKEPHIGAIENAPMVMLLPPPERYFWIARGSFEQGFGVKLRCKGGNI